MVLAGNGWNVTRSEGVELIRYASSKGINILDCWMPDPKSRNIIGEGIKENREQWYIQGHIGATWKDEQYYRTRDMRYVRPYLRGSAETAADRLYRHWHDPLRGFRRKSGSRSNTPITWIMLWNKGKGHHPPYRDELPQPQGCPSKPPGAGMWK